MKYNIGDIVTIKKDLKEGRYGDEYVVHDMLKYRNKRCRIIENKAFYILEILSPKIKNNEISCWYWTDEMLN